MKLGARVAAGWFAVALVASLSSCSAAAAYISVARGNAAYDRGSYQQATVDYLNAAGQGVYPKWIAYDLGNVYHALGEPEGAAGEWQKVESTNDPGLAAATAFNEGILDYELGKYRDAYEKFRHVLELHPDDIDAKVDLELSYQKMQNREQPPRSGRASETVGVRRNTSEVNNVLNLVRQKQDNYWQAPKQPKEQPNVPNW